MADVKPFRAIRPKEGLERRIAAPSLRCIQQGGGEAGSRKGTVVFSADRQGRDAVCR